MSINFTVKELLELIEYLEGKANKETNLLSFVKEETSNSLLYVTLAFSNEALTTKPLMSLLIEVVPYVIELELSTLNKEVDSFEAYNFTSFS